MKQFFLIILLPLLVACAGRHSGPLLEELRTLRKDANSAYLDRDYGRSIELYREVLEVNENDAIVWFRLGNAYSHTGRPNEAILAYRKAVVLDSGLSKAWYNMGVIFLRQAANSWTQMVQYTPTSDPLYFEAVKFSNETLKLLGDGGNDEAEGADQQSEN